MNYIRGAVNAISAPYQYYKELPPINPSTLTGAIDVIVIQRPESNGETELACSPFHVRFGKWQVLRPSEKKVNVSVNGCPIPYDMKIGEAGEAFFVFETDDDVPPDLITSPILQPTRPEEETTAAQTDASSGAPLDHAETQEETLELVYPPSTKVSEQETQSEFQEPEFLDLNADRNEKKVEGELHRDVNLTPTQQFRQPSFLRRSASRNTIQQPRRSTEVVSKPVLGLPSPPISRSTTPEMEEQDKRVDEALKCLGEEIDAPKVKYHEDVALDIEGYHPHAKEASDQTARSSDSERFAFPSLPSRSSRTPPSAPPLESHSTHNPTPSDTDSDSGTNEPSSSLSPSRLHPLRATSEPPPDLDEHHPRPPSDAEFNLCDSDITPSGSRTKTGLTMPSSTTGVQEYSWEWGAFPTPSPMKAAFGKSGRLESAIPWKGKLRQFDNLLEVEVSDENVLLSGKLFSEGEDETTFVWAVGNKILMFELSSVTQPLSKEHTNGRGEGKEETKSDSLLAGYDEIATRFEEGKLTFSKFMRDNDLITSPTLVIKWVNGQFIARQDNPSLFEVLACWRSNTLKAQAEGNEPEEEEEEATNEMRHARSKSAPPDQEQAVEAERTEGEAMSEKNSGSLSWVQWWGRNRRRGGEGGGRSISGVGERPVLRPAASAPAPAGAETAPIQTSSLVSSDQTLKRLSAEKTGTAKAGTEPALPSTPSEVSLTGEAPKPSDEAPLVPEKQQQPSKKFAKTLRLTSDQLKTLDLKPGANTITFSISSGVIACTARIFVWDYRDLIVISDIDGTITKSDGLGHVFAMIGRDWTHVGVAKLYTDIVRNGYKIMYLTSRAIGQADSTRGYLKGIKQNNYQLPEGPVIMSPDRLMASLHREVIMRKPEVFKMACLRDIQRLFGERAKKPFYAGFGNRITDALSYRSVNVPSARIFTIDSTGEVKMELLELAGYKSSYIHMTDLVDQMFPPIHKKWAPEYTDFNYWKLPVPEYPLPDLTPPSPTLSARSDTSNQSTLAKLRNFRLMGSRPSSISSPPNGFATDNVNSNSGDITSNDSNRDPELRQMSSFERFVNGLRRSVSPSSASRSSYAADSDSESDFDGPHGGEWRHRRRSMTSMPGSLDDLHFGLDDEGEDTYWEGRNDNEQVNGNTFEDDEAYDGAYEGEVDEDMDIDEDVLAATEMKKIPFL